MGIFRGKYTFGGMYSRDCNFVKLDFDSVIRGKHRKREINGGFEKFYGIFACLKKKKNLLRHL